MAKIKILTKKQISLIAATLACLIILLAGFFYAFNTSFKEDVNELYYSTYYNFFIDPSMTTVADKKANIAYCDTASRQQKMDIYLPKHLDGPVGAVMYVHGGGWISGDKSNPFLADYGAEVVKSGLAFISVNYRLAPYVVYPAQNQDVDCAIAYLKTHGASLNIDMSHFGIMGDSAGGQLASMAALTSPDKNLIKAVVDFYGPADVWAQVTRRPTPDKWAIDYLGTSTDEALARRASPLFANLRGAPPFLIFHGLNDRTVYYAQSLNFDARLKAAGVDATLVPVQNAGHFFTVHSRPSLNAIEAQMITFLKQHL